MADKHGFWDWKSLSADGAVIRRRLVFTPKGTTTLARTGQPAWGAGTSGLYRRLPDDALYSASVAIAESGFDKIPVGQPDAAPMQVAFNLTPLTLGSVDDQAVVDQLLAPQYDYPAGDTLTFAEVTGGAGPVLEIYFGAAYRRINTANTFTLLNDDGNSALGIDAFRVEFQGAHLVDPNAPTEHQVGAHPIDPWKLSITVAPMLLAIAEAVVANDVLIRMDIGAADVTHQILVDTPWKIGSTGYARVAGSYPLSSSRDVYQMFLWSDFFVAIRDLLQNAYRTFLRDGGASFTMVGVGGGAGAEFGPYEFAAKKLPNYSSGGGADLSGASVAWRFPGLCYASDDGSHTPYGGYLHDDGENDSTLFAYDSMYQYLKDIAEQCVVIATIAPTSQTGIGITWIGTRATSPTLAISPEHVRAGAYPITTGAEIVTSATCEIPGTQDGDVQSVTAKLSTRADTNPRSVPQPWQCGPSVGASAEHWYLAQTDSGSGLTTHMVGTPLRAWNTLWAVDSAAGLFSPGKPVRMHHNVGLYDGATMHHEVTAAVALPTPAGTVDATTYLSLLWLPLREAMLRMQSEGCLSNASCLRMATEFGRPDQAIYTLAVDAWRAAPSQLGLRTGTDFATAEDLTGRAALAAVPARAHLLKTGIATTNDIAKIQLFALGALT